MNIKKLVASIVVAMVAMTIFAATLPCASASKVEIESLQQWVDEQGYNYTVAENWIADLSPEQQEALCGYKPLEAPEEPISENIIFFSGVSAAETSKVEQPPSSYDAMALGYVTPVKDQSTCGSCYIFAATADFESDVAIGESGLPDFAEQQVGDCNIWSSAGEYDFCGGGNARMTTNYFTKYGAADEVCCPYAAPSQSCCDCPILKNIDNWRMITDGTGNDLSHVATIKNAILNYGPVYSTINASDDGFKYYYGGIYEDLTPGGANHAIEIIGWDDSMGTAGAWLIKNSWGTGWGASGPYPGCAWVDYGSANIGDYTSAIAGYKDPGDTIFYYDECGWMGWCIYEPCGAVRFIPSEDLTLTAVDFWAVDSGISYEIKIFDTLDDLGDGDYNFSDQLGSTQTGITDEPGYYSIPLATSVPLTGGDDFIVQVGLTSSYPGGLLPVDYCTVSWLPNWSAIATFSGESYCSGDGSTFTKPIYDIYDIEIDIGIRARAGVKDCTYSPLNLSKDDGVDACADPGDTITYTICYDNLPNPTGDVHNAVIVDQLPPGVSFVSASGGGIYDSLAHNVTWDIGTVTKSAPEVCVTLNVTVNAGTGGTTFTNTCTIDGAETEPATVYEYTDVPESVPTLTPFGLTLLIGFMTLVGFAVLRRWV